VHGISQTAQAIDIAAQGSPSDFQALAEIDSGPIALRLK
jgi:hypothetical protein